MAAEYRTTTLGSPRVGRDRAYKWMLEQYWAGESDTAALLERTVRREAEALTTQRELGVDLVARAQEMIPALRNMIAAVRIVREELMGNLPPACGCHTQTAGGSRGNDPTPAGTAHPGEVGFDAYATVVLVCDNQTDARLWTDPPSPQPEDRDYYQTFLDRVSRFYTERFAAIPGPR